METGELQKPKRTPCFTEVGTALSTLEKGREQGRETLQTRVAATK